MQLINQLNEAHAHLLALAEEKKQVLIANDMRRLSEIVKEEPVHIKRIEALEQERLALMGSVTMTEWIATHPEDVDSLRTLLQTIGQLRQLNTLNAELLEQSLHYLDWHLQLLIPEADDFTYGQSALNQTHFNRNA
ncbi:MULTISPECIES: flagellar protein FlgN [Exiguobacterium]|uniref:flagellar protein FlgN n=1 Tax=Exiguobacterium TaxID=33986 RepID=UPI000648ADDB|nr:MULTISPECIES: flagellar protein FlgN [Exiguobacterium]MBF8151968.1 flagellar protein FlgN [Exiguobacterium sp. TBG-PICH-001]QZY86270.1 flagellar protein FlgN [Exiguobacterium acetylicum]